MKHLIALALLFVSPIAYGQGVPLHCTPLEAIPNPAKPNMPVVATTTCSCFFPLESPRILRQGTEILVTYEASSLCGVPPPPITLEFALGGLPPGEYRVIHAPVAEWGDPFETQQVVLGVLPYSVPALGSPGMLLMLMIVIITGIGHLASRSQYAR